MAERRAEYERVFASMDKNHSGTLETNELRAALAKIGMDLPEDKIKALFILINDNNQTSLTLDQFIRFCYVLEHADYKDPKTVLFFASDIDFNGTVDRFELSKIFKKLSVFPTDKQLDRILDRFGQGQEKELTFINFMKLFQELLK